MAGPSGDAPKRSLFEAFSNTDQADVSGKGQSLMGMLRAIGGTSDRTRSGIDLTRAAERVGVSRRTVERWVSAEETGQGQRPSAQHQKTLTRRSRQAASTQRGRASTVRDSGLRRTFAGGARLSISANQGPIDPIYRRLRTTGPLDLDPDQAQAMIEAYENGGEKGFLKWASNHWDSGYLDGWEIDSSKGLSVDIQSAFGGQ